MGHRALFLDRENDAARGRRLQVRAMGGTHSSRGLDYDERMRLDGHRFETSVQLTGVRARGGRVPVRWTYLEITREDLFSYGGYYDVK